MVKPSLQWTNSERQALVKWSAGGKDGFGQEQDIAGVWLYFM